MVDDKTTEVISAQPGLTPADIYAGNYIEKGFKKFHIMPGGEFVYTIHSFSIGGATPIVMFVGAYGFFMTVSKERIVKDASGVEKRERIDGPGWDQVVLFEGAIAQVGVGASIDLKKVKVVQTGLAGVPGEIAFRTCVDIPSQSDFNGARFTVHALKIGTVAAVVGKGAIINSAFVQFTLENGVVLDATVESNMTVKVGFDWDKVQSKIEKKQPRSVSDLKSLARDIAMPEVSLLQYVHSAGKLLLRDRDLGKAPTLAPSVQKQRQQARRTRTTLFDVDSATLDAATRGWMEAQLAIDRALFEATGGSGIAEGYASPEATEDHNQKLSETRAQAVVQAVKDAFGSTLAIPIQATGYGETPATEPNGTLLNPPDTPGQIASLSSDDRNRLFIEKKLHWPSWRRVDLTVNNALVVTVMGRGARPD
jgi:outer membrane protein OmpA-like peptidoglycan-associated protein